MLADCVVRHARVVTPDAILEGGIAVQAGRIVAVGADAVLPSAHEVIDAEGRWLLPGLIDPHVHLGLILPLEQDCESETRAAAAGGVTTLLSFVIEPGPLLPAVERHRAALEGRAWVDVAFHAALMSREHLAEIDGCLAQGVTSFKLFLAYKGREGERLRITAADDGLLVLALEALSARGGRPMVHAENSEIAWELSARLQHRRELAAWADGRPDWIEAEAVQRACFLAEQTGSPIHFVHLSAARSVQLVREARARGVAVVAETGPHYLALTCDDPRLRDPLLAKITPPVKWSADREGLWQGLADGTIGTLGTDHAANLRANKLGPDEGSVWTTRPGFPGLETLLPVLVTEGVLRGRLSWSDLVRLTAEGNARAYGLWPRKGALRVGADADLVLVDDHEEREVRGNRQHGASDYTPFEGWRLRGWAVLTMVRGRIVMRDGAFLGAPGHGRFTPTAPRGKEVEDARDIRRRPVHAATR